MIKTTSHLVSVLAVLCGAALVPLGAFAQSVQIPPILIGVWNNHLGVACDARSEVNGITITSRGEIIENDGRMICQIENLSIDDASPYELARWSYKGLCKLQTKPGKEIPLFGWMSLKAPEGSQPAILDRFEDQVSFGSLWDLIPMTRRMTVYRRCAKS